MTRAGRTLDALIAGLDGRATDGADWDDVLHLANHALLTPALFSALARAGEIERLPQDVRGYLEFIHDRNRERNLRLRDQLMEAVAALNRSGIRPLLLKGAAALFLSPPERVPDRMTSDLDVAVDPLDEPAARACLMALGYAELTEVRGMARPQDAAILELRPARADDFEPPEPVDRDGASAKIPSAESRACHWIVHDLLKEGDYLRGRLDLRHLRDIAQIDDTDGLDWEMLRRVMSGGRARNALETQLLTLHRLFGTRIPAECARRPVIRFQTWRRVFTARHPVLGAPLRLAGNMFWGASRAWRAPTLVRRNPTQLARRIALMLLDRDLRSKV